MKILLNRGSSGEDTKGFARFGFTTYIPEPNSPEPDEILTIIPDPDSGSKPEPKPEPEPEAEPESEPEADLEPESESE